MIIKEDDPKFYDFEPSHTSQGREEMGKEEILEQSGFDFDAFQLDNEYSAKNLLSAMDTFAQNRTAKLQTELGEVKKKLEKCVKALDREMKKYNQ